MTSLTKSKYSKIYFFSLLAILCLLLFYFGSSKPKPEATPLPTVTVAQVTSKIIAEKITLPGTLVSPVIVKVRPRVDGQILQVHIADGAIVKKDQLLFTLDDALLQAQLAQAQGSFDRDQANLQYAESEVKRNRPLLERTYTSASKFDQTFSTAQSGRGSLQSDQGLIDQYKTQISYTKIYSPIDGRIGYININEGNYVHATDTDFLATIVQLDPIEFRFALPEKYLSYLQKDDLPKVQARLLNIDKKPYEKMGYLKSLDNQVDLTSGTLLVAASFENKDYKLLPGQYMTVEFALSAPTDVLIVPVEAVQIGQASSYVYVYHAEDQTVHYQPVETEALDDKIALIKEGLTGGETVVTSGQLKLKDKIKVKVINSPPSSPKGH